uniref:Translin-associated protein x n=1 Tax=Triatoma infestans TaxID=30076 RepID=A0A170UP94_TRIIF
MLFENLLMNWILNMMNMNEL